MTATINNQSLAVKEYQNQRVVTFSDIDKVHERPDGTAKRNFTANKEHFIEGEDYFKIAKNQKDEFRTFEIPNRGIIVLTEFGYLLLVKSLNDKLAWKVQRELVKSYFRAKENQSLQLTPNYPHLDQSVYHLQQSYRTANELLIEYGYRIHDLEDEVSNLKAYQIDSHRFDLVCRAVELNNKRLYKLEYARHRQDEILGMLANDDPIVSQTGKALMLPTDEYKAWVKKSVIEISSKRKANTLSVYRELYNRLDTDKSSSEVAKEWRDAIKNDGYITYKTYNEYTSRPTRVKLIRDIFDAVCFCGETHTYELKDLFTELVVRELEGE